MQFEVTEFYCIFYRCFLSSRILRQINNFKLFPRNEAVINLNAATLSLLANIPPEYTSELETSS